MNYKVENNKKREISEDCKRKEESLKKDKSIIGRKKERKRGRGKKEKEDEERKEKRKKKRWKERN